MTDENVKLVVNTIISSEENGYSRITLGFDTFNAVRGATPLLPVDRLETGDTGEQMRVFKFKLEDNSEVEVYSLWTRGENAVNGQTLFFMKTEDAKKCQSLTDPAPFSLSSVNREVIPSRAPVPTPA